MTSSEVTLLFEYVQRLQELKDTVAQQIEHIAEIGALADERIANLECIAQALADELIDADANWDVEHL